MVRGSVIIAADHCLRGKYDETQTLASLVWLLGRMKIASAIKMGDAV